MSCFDFVAFSLYQTIVLNSYYDIENIIKLQKDHMTVKLISFTNIMILRFVNYFLPVRTYIKSRNESRSKKTPPVKFDRCGRELGVIYLLLLHIDVQIT